MEWWVNSLAYFNGRCIQPPPIPPPTDPYSRDDIPEEIYRLLREKDKNFQDLNEKVLQHETYIQKMFPFFMKVIFFFFLIEAYSYIN